MSVLDDYKWPSTFPKGVPPEGVLPANGRVYRAVKRVPPDESDFLTTREDNPRREFVTTVEKQRSHGVSFFNKMDVLKDKVRRYQALQNRIIVHGNLLSALGVVSSNNKNGHLTLWKCIGSKPHECINVPVSELL